MQLFEVTSTKAKQYIEKCFRTGSVPFLQSSPGCGKSAIYKQVADKFGLVLIDLRLSMMESVDLNGYPDLSDGTAKYIPFDVFPLEDTPIPEGKNGWLLLLDEINSAPRDVIAAAYKPVLDHMVGNHKLHSSCVVAAAGNLDTDNAITNDMGTAFQSRLIHLHLKVDLNTWLNQVALKEHYDERIIAYLNYEPNKLINFKPDHTDVTFASPRTWSFLNGLIKGEQDLDDLTPLVVGAIGSEVGLDFIKFTSIYKNLISIDAVVDDPENVDIPHQSANRWATVTHLVSRSNDKNFKEVVTYILRFSLDFKVLFAHMIASTNPDLLSHPQWSRIIKSVGARMKELNSI